MRNHQDRLRRRALAAALICSGVAACGGGDHPPPRTVANTVISEADAQSNVVQGGTIRSYKQEDRIVWRRGDLAKPAAANAVSPSP
jgi:hypothetical protein